MAKTDARVDAYISKAAPFAQEILLHLRDLVHRACPQVQETIKWGMPHFEYRGLLCSMAAFRAHCAFGFWKASLLNDTAGILHITDKNAMGHLDKIRSLKDLPADKVLISYIKQAVELNETGVQAPRTKKAAVAPETPAFLAKALLQNKKARAVFEAFSPSNKKEYIEWLTEAKTEATRERRLQQAIEWMAEGKTRNWKYERK